MEKRVSGLSQAISAAPLPKQHQEPVPMAKSVPITMNAKGRDIPVSGSQGMLESLASSISSSFTYSPSTPSRWQEFREESSSFGRSPSNSMIQVSQEARSKDISQSKLMDKIKEKLEKLRIEADQNLARAESADTQVKTLKAEVESHQGVVQSLNNKISLLQGDVERAEKRAEDNKVKKAESEMDISNSETQGRKIQMLERNLDDKERDRKEAVEKARHFELEAERHERKSKQLEAEKAEVERKLEDMSKRYAEVKQELDKTLKDLEGL